MAQVDYFLKIEGVESESTDAKHKGEIELESFSWGETQSGTAGRGGGAGAGKVQPQDFNFVKKHGQGIAGPVHRRAPPGSTSRRRFSRRARPAANSRTT